MSTPDDRITAALDAADAEIRLLRAELAARDASDVAIGSLTRAVEAAIARAIPRAEIGPRGDPAIDRLLDECEWLIGRAEGCGDECPARDGAGPLVAMRRLPGTGFGGKNIGKGGGGSKEAGGGEKPKPKGGKQPKDKPKPEEPAWKPGTPLHADKPIGERIKLAKHLDEKHKAIADLDDAVERHIAPLKEKQHAIQKEMEDFVAKKAAEGITDPAALIEGGLGEIDKRFVATIDEISVAREQARSRAQEHLAEILRVPAEARAAWSHRDGRGFAGNAKNVRTRAEVAAWLESKTAAGGRDAPISVGWESKPRVRAYASEGRAMIMVKADESPGTMAHELGHHLEYRLPGAQKAAQEFLAHRVGNQPPQSLRQKFGRGYAAHEMGRDDDFAKAFGDRGAWYVGKHYDHGSTEIISMGVEKMHDDPVGFAKSDPEYFKFVAGILDGSLRKP